MDSGVWPNSPRKGFERLLLPLVDTASDDHDIVLAWSNAGP
jgi:hypothetical protein